MAFMGMFIIFVILVLLFIAFNTMIVSFILAIVSTNKKKTVSSVIFWSIGSLLLTGFIILGVLIFGPKSVEIETPTGQFAKVPKKEANAYIEAISQEDIQTTKAKMDRYPELIYYTGFNGQSPLDKASNTLNIELAECVINHGAVYDDKFMHRESIYNYSLEYFFATQTTDDLVYPGMKINSMVSFMLENGAGVNFDNTNQPNALFSSVWYICRDGVIQDMDLTLLQMLIDHGANISEQNTIGEYPTDFLKMAAEQNSVPLDSENYIKAEKLLSNK